MTRKKPSDINETDLYGPVRDYLVAQGYSVRGEVEHCDIAARKGEELIIVELKRQFGVDVLMQATERQRVSDSVYVAIPRPKHMGRGKRWNGLRRLLRQLELGLIVVSFTRAKPLIEVVFHPLPYARKKHKRRRRAVIEEMAGRSGDYNEGGSSKKALMTAYRENAVQIACYLETLGPQSPRVLRGLGTGAKTWSILYHNHYGWFERVGRGTYAITNRGRRDLEGYRDLTRHYAAVLGGKVNDQK